MVKSKKKDDKKLKAISSFLEFVEAFDISSFKYIPIFCLDVSSSSTGFMMLGADIMDDDNELPDMIPICKDIDMWDIEQTVISKEKVPYGSYPNVLNKVIDFKIAVTSVLLKSEKRFMEKYNITPEVFYSRSNMYPKFLAVESVFLFQKSAIINLTRFQNTAIGILSDRGYIPFEYDNQEAKSLLGAQGKKEYVTPLINDMYGLDIPCTEKYSHVSDAVALGYLHNYIMRRAIRERS